MSYNVLVMPSKNKQPETVSEVLASIRLSRSQSQTELAKMLKISRSYIAVIEHGTVKYPMDYIKKLDKVMRLTNGEMDRLEAALAAQLKEELRGGR